MLQQINLFTYLPTPVKPFLPPITLAIYYSCFVILLCLISFNGLWQKHKIQSALEKINIELATAQQNLADIQQRYPSINPKELDNTVRHLQQDLLDKSQVLHYLAHQVKYSNYLRGLALASLPTVWLTDFTFSSTEKEITLNGHAKQSTDLQEFLTRLEQQPLFNGMLFELQELTNTKSLPGSPVNNYLTFHITNKVDTIS